MDALWSIDVSSTFKRAKQSIIIEFIITFIPKYTDSRGTEFPLRECILWVYNAYVKVHMGYIPVLRHTPSISPRIQPPAPLYECVIIHSVWGLLFALSRANRNIVAKAFKILQWHCTSTRHQCEHQQQCTNPGRSLAWPGISLPGARSADRT